MMKFLEKISAAEKKGVSLLEARPDPETGEKSPFKEPVWGAAVLYLALGAAWVASVYAASGPSIARAETTDVLRRWDAGLDLTKKNEVLALADKALEGLQPSSRKEGESNEAYFARLSEEERTGRSGLSKRTVRSVVSKFEREANQILSPEAATDATDDLIGRMLEYMVEKSESAESPAKRALYQSLGNELLFGRWYAELEKAAESAARDARKLKISGADDPKELAQEILQTGSVRALRDMSQILSNARKNKTSVLQGIKESLIRDVYGAKKEVAGDVEKAGGIVGATPGYEVVVKGPAQIAYERGGLVEMAKASDVEKVIEEVGHQPFMWTRDGKQFLVLRKNVIKTDAEPDVRVGRKRKLSKDDPRYPRVAIKRNVSTFYAVDPDEWKKAQSLAPKGANDDEVLEIYKSRTPEVDAPEELEKLLKKMSRTRVLKRIPIEPESERSYTQEQLDRLDAAVSNVNPTAIIRRAKAEDDEGKTPRDVEAGGVESDVGRRDLDLFEESLETGEFITEVSRRMSGERSRAMTPLQEVVKLIPELSVLAAEDLEKNVTDADLSKIRTLLGRVERGDVGAIGKPAYKKLLEIEKKEISRTMADPIKKGLIDLNKTAELSVQRKLPQRIRRLVEGAEYELDNRKVLRDLERELSFVDPRRARTGKGLTYAQMLDLELSREHFPSGSLKSGPFLRKLDKWRIARRPEESLEAYEERRKRAAARVRVEEEPRLGTSILKDAELLQKARNKVLDDLTQIRSLQEIVAKSADPAVRSKLPELERLADQISRMNRVIAPRIQDEATRLKRDEAVRKVRVLQKQISDAELKLAMAPEGSKEQQRLDFALNEMLDRFDRITASNPGVAVEAKSLEDRELEQRQIEKARADAIGAAEAWEKAYERDLAEKYPVSFDKDIEAKYGPMVLKKNRARLLRDLSLAESRLRGRPSQESEHYKTAVLLNRLQEYVPPRFSLAEQSEETRNKRERFLQIAGQVGETDRSKMPRFVRRVVGKDPSQIAAPSDVLGQSLTLLEATSADREFAVQDIASSLDEYLRAKNNLENLEGRLGDLKASIERYRKTHGGEAPKGREEAELLVLGGGKKWRGRSAARVLSPEGSEGLKDIQNPIDYWIRFYTYQNAMKDAEDQRERSRAALENLEVDLGKTDELRRAYEQIASAKSAQERDAAVRFFAGTPALAKAVFLAAERRAALKRGQ